MRAVASDFSRSEQLIYEDVQGQDCCGDAKRHPEPPFDPMAAACEELELTRTNIRRQLETATNENRRAQLKAALAHIEAEIAKL